MKKNENVEVEKTLDEIIRELTAYPKNHRDIDNQIFIFDVTNDEIIEEKPIFSFNKFRYFEVNRRKVIFKVKGPELSLPYSNSENPFIVNITYDVQIAEKGASKLVRFAIRASTPLIAINNAVEEVLSTYIFKHDDFVIEFNKYKPELLKTIREIGLKYGLELRPNLVPNVIDVDDIPDFVPFEHTVMSKTNDAQTVEIKHDITLTLMDRIKVSLSGIKDLKAWAKGKLDQYTSNAIIEMSYASVLINMDKSIIKNAMQKASQEIGYDLRQLISAPSKDNEQFYFETADESLTGNREFSTIDEQFKIAINVVVNGKLDFQDSKTHDYIRPGHDIIVSMKKMVIESVRIFLNKRTPEDCFLKMYQLDGLLVKEIKRQLNLNYGFKDLNITIKFLETNLSKRFLLLQERPFQVEIIGDFTEKPHVIWFRVTNISPKGWHRFRANNYTTKEEELTDVGLMVKHGMTNIFNTNSNGESIVQEFNKVQKRVVEAFGLEIKMHDYTEGLTAEELMLIGGIRIGLAGKTQQMQNIITAEKDELDDLLDRRRVAKQTDESEEVIKKIDDQIQAIKIQATYKNDNLLTNKTNRDFLLPPDNS